MKQYIYILIVGLSVLFACREIEPSSYSKDVRKRVDSMINKNGNLDSLLILLDTFKKENNLYGQVAAYKKLGKVYRENAFFEKAIQYHKNGLEIASQMNDTLEIVEALNDLGTNYRRIGILSEASECHFKALNLI